MNYLFRSILVNGKPFLQHRRWNGAHVSRYLHDTTGSPHSCGPCLTVNSFYNSIQLCIKNRDIKRCIQIYHLIKLYGLANNVLLCNHLTRMFAVCGRLREANYVFGSLCIRNSFTWVNIISANGNLGEAWKAIEMYYFAWVECQEITEPCIFSAALKACTNVRNLREGMLIHCHAVGTGFDSNLSVGNSLIDMYSKCRSLDDAFEVLKGLPDLDVVTWGTVIAACVQEGRYQDALLFFKEMQEQGGQPNQIIFSSIVKAYSRMPPLDGFALIHANVTESGFESDEFIGSGLIEMYANYGSVEDAHAVFQRLPKQDVVAWTNIINAYAQHCLEEEATLIFLSMINANIRLNHVTFISLMECLISKRSPCKGMVVHSYILELGLQHNAKIGSMLLHMYNICVSFKDACKLFESLHNRDIVIWHEMIAGCVQYGHEHIALEFFERMQYERVLPNEWTFITILQACSGLETLCNGRLVHSLIIESSFDHFVHVANALIHMYSKYGNVHEAHILFDILPVRSIETWGALIGGYVQHDCFIEAARIFALMEALNILPDEAIFIYMLRTCTRLSASEDGRTTHAYIIETNHLKNMTINNALIFMYAETNYIDDASKMFTDCMANNVITSSMMIEALTKAELLQDASELFLQMQQEGIEATQVTFISVLGACSNAYEGKKIHTQMLENGYLNDIRVGNTLVAMYARCQSTLELFATFEKLVVRDTVTWNIVISHCSVLNNYELVLHYFEDMQKNGVMPDAASFVSILVACNHMGLVKEGCHHFISMQEKYGIPPSELHFNIMLDLLGRTGCLNEADGILQSTPFSLDNIALISLLGHCREHGNLDLARERFHQLIEIGV